MSPIPFPLLSIQSLVVPIPTGKQDSKEQNQTSPALKQTTEKSLNKDF